MGIVVGNDGRLTGVLKGAAVRLVRDAITPKPFDLLMREFDEVLKEARAGGITTIQDITSAQMLRVYQETRARGRLTARMMRGGPHPLDRFASQLRWNPGS